MLTPKNTKSQTNEGEEAGTNERVRIGASAGERTGANEAATPNEEIAGEREVAGMGADECAGISEQTFAQLIKEARAEIARILFEIDDITLQINPRLEAEYAVKIGCLENSLLKWQIAARRAKRAYTLAQARINAGEQPDDDLIEAQLDQEFEAWEAKLKESVDRFLTATERMAGKHLMSRADSRRLTKLHRTLVKRLHPDLHPNQSEEEKRFFAMAQAAYELGDLEMLRSIELSTQGMGDEDEDVSVDNLPDDEAAAELELVRAQVRVHDDQLEELKRKPPYCFKEKLEDGNWVIESTCELKGQIETQKQAEAEYRRAYAKLVGRADDGAEDIAD